MNAEQHMCNIEKRYWGEFKKFEFENMLFLSREYVTKLASHTGCAVCLRYDS